MARSRRVALTSSLLLAAGFLTIVGGMAYAQTKCMSSAEGDVNGDGYSDVVVRKPGSTVDGMTDAGAVTVHLGNGQGSVTISQNTEGVPGEAEQGDRFGYATALYDADEDGCDDLVVSAPYEDVGSAKDAGAVWLIPGSPDGLKTDRASSFSQNSAGVPGTAEPGDGFGMAVAASDDGGHRLLVIGTPGEDHHARNSGSVYIAVHKLEYIQVVHQDTPGVGGHQEPDDRFGSSVAASGQMVAVGVPGEDIGSAADAGMAHLFWAADDVAHFRTVHQDTAGISGTAESGDQFAASVDLQVTRGGPTEDTYDLAVGSPGERLGDTGKEHGSAYRIRFVDPADNSSAEIKERFAVNQNTPGVRGVAEDGDRFGETVHLSSSPPNCDDPAICRAVPGFVVLSDEGTDAEEGDAPAIQAFGDTTEPGEANFWIKAGEYELPADADLSSDQLDGYGYNLYLRGAGDRVYGLPWRNVIAGADDPVLIYG